MAVGREKHRDGQDESAADRAWPPSSPPIPLRRPRSSVTREGARGRFRPLRRGTCGEHLASSEAARADRGRLACAREQQSAPTSWLGALDDRRSASWPEMSTSGSSDPIPRRSRSPPSDEAAARVRGSIRLRRWPEQEGQAADRSAQWAAAPPISIAQRNSAPSGVPNGRDVGDGERERAETGPVVEPDEDERADAGGEQTRDEHDSEHRAAESGHFHHEERSDDGRPEQRADGREAPAAPITIFACGRVSLDQCTASTPRPLPMAIAGPRAQVRPRG